MAGPKDYTKTYVNEHNIGDELEKWMEDISAYQWRQIEPIVPEKTALIVIDMTKPFVEEGQPLSCENTRAIVPSVKNLVEQFRKIKRPVLWLVQGHHSVEFDRGKQLSRLWPNTLLEGTSDVEMAAEFDVPENEKVIMKRRFSGFYQTDLECTLRSLGIEQVVICGVFSHACVYTTAFDAFFRDFCVYYPADCTAAPNRELHINALRGIAGWCGYVMRSRDIIAQLKPGSDK